MNKRIDPSTGWRETKLTEYSRDYVVDDDDKDIQTQLTNYKEKVISVTILYKWK